MDSSSPSSESCSSSSVSQPALELAFCPFVRDTSFSVFGCFFLVLVICLGCLYPYLSSCLHRHHISFCLADLSSPEFSPVEPRSRPLALLKSALSSNPLADLLPLLIRQSLPQECLRKPARGASFRIRTPSRPLGSVQTCSTERNRHLTREAGRRSLDARSWNNEALSTSAYSRYPEGPKRNTMQFHAHVPRC